MKLSARIWLLAAVMGLAVGCASTTETQAVAADPAVLRVGVTPNAPPMIFKADGRIIGVEADLAEVLGQHLGRKVVFVEEKWDNLIDSLCDNKFDIIMSSMSITPTRSYRIAFSDPYLKVGQMVLARADEKYKYMANIATQAKRGIGVKEGTTADFLVQQELPGASRKYFKNGDDAAAALIRNKIDIFISDAPMIWYLAAHYEAKGLVITPMVLTQEQLGWGVARTNTKLLEEVNKFLRKGQASGELNRVFSRWMPGFQ
jgi:polar amino acid transport system substrate-binding protein